MLAQADALPQALKPAGEARWREPVARSDQGRSEFDKREIGRDAYASYDPAGVVVVASAWLAFYVIAALHLL
jgi:hypothetical protein